MSATWGELLTPRNLASTVTLCLGVALFAFNEFFIATALPSAVQDLGGTALLSWAFTVYLVFAIIGGMMAAHLKQRFGARRTLLAAASVFIVGTLIATVATEMLHVLVGRLLQGAGEGVVAALCYALIPELFPSRLVPKVFGAEAIVWATAAFSGPLVAGVLTEHWSWRLAFFVSLPAAVIFIILVLFIVPKAAQASASTSTLPLSRLALAGVGILMISLAGTVDAVLLMSLFLAGAMVLLAVVVGLDRRSENPMLPRAAFSLDKALGAGLWVVLLMPLAQAAAAVFLIYSLQHLWMLSPTVAGAIGAGMAVSWSLTAIAVASLKSAETRHLVMQVGPVLVLIGLFLVALAIGTDQLWLVIPAQGAIGAGFGTSWGTLSQLMMDVSSDEERDRTSAMLPTLQSAGYAIGAAFFGLVANTMGFGEGIGAEVLRSAMLVVFTGSCLVASLSAMAGLRMARLVRIGKGQ
ncbi:MFS transporter [Rhizobium sp. 32-5/1]|uniref:MFS transporter n=1 Tax=Rhizobium sp. 32-5/1 TaxID=3019602 RepID=UPI00240DA40C|nr:MFS transporter [Rhizobium sp. 32-5/1]WEZ85140.1 MFS transporter [Rhizobium sp. 32-5/1]